MNDSSGSSWASDTHTNSNPSIHSSINDRSLSASLRGDYMYDTPLIALTSPQPSPPLHVYHTVHPGQIQQPPMYLQQPQQPPHPVYLAQPEPVQHPSPSSPQIDQPPVPLSAMHPGPHTPASIAAEQAAAAQVALRQAEQNARVAQIHANALSGKIGAEGAEIRKTTEEVAVRKTAGKYNLKDFLVERT